MIDKVFNILTNPSLVSTSQNTVASVTIETSLKAVGRPAATLLDNHADKKTRQYSSVKELFYQILCLGIYMSVIPLFKKGGCTALTVWGILLLFLGGFVIFLVSAILNLIAGSKGKSRFIKYQAEKEAAEKYGAAQNN